jgi:DNA-binding response OmpR family regulator
MRRMESVRGVIVVAEDEGRVAQVMTTRLGSDGHEVHWVRTARDVRTELRERPCDLLLLDISLETDGLELLQALRFAPEAPRGGIVMLADREDVSSQERAQQLGAAAVLSKPLDLAGLSATVRDLLECM